MGLEGRGQIGLAVIRFNVNGKTRTKPYSCEDKIFRSSVPTSLIGYLYNPQKLRLKAESLAG